MARRERGDRQRAALERQPRGRRGGLFTGLVMGAAAGLVLAAGLAWYFYARPGEFKAPPGVDPQPPAVPRAAPASPEPPAATPPPVEIPPPPAPRATPGKAPAAAAGEPGYSFYDILPGDKPNQPQDPKLAREVWWLQVAALKAEQDARALKAKLALLGLEVKVQRVDSAAGPLWRVRVGPFKIEDDALGALDTLAANDYEPRLFKEQSLPEEPRR